MPVHIRRAQPHVGIVLIAYGTLIRGDLTGIDDILEQLMGAIAELVLGQEYKPGKHHNTNVGVRLGPPGVPRKPPKGVST